MSIQPLPSLLVNQIAAGEVVERPASVVKELIDNAIDAGATKVDITIENGGCDSIRVADDGDGIAADELLLAVSPHATSKIRVQDDLDCIATMGFRGEALASIASVSRMTIRSRTRESSTAFELHIEGDQVGAVQPAGGPEGTSVTVRNLFFNTPARRRFLRTTQTEGSRITDVVRAHALAHPHIAFTLRSNDRDVIDLVSNHESQQRIISILGEEFADQLIPFTHESDGITLHGMAGRPAIARGTGQHQHIFVNGRSIRDRTIQHAMKEAYRGLIDPMRHPTIVIFLEMDPALVDVNVHPTKAEVRFRKQSVMHSLVLHTIREALRDADLVPELNLAKSSGAASLLRADSPLMGSGLSNEKGSEDGADSGEQAGRRFVEFFQRLDPKQKGFVYTEVKQALADEMPELVNDVSNGTALHESDDAESMPAIRNAISVLQVHSSYIVTQDEQGLLIIDQHALHERVMFEQLNQQLSSGTLESQRLLMPSVVDVDSRGEEMFEELQPLLMRIGIEAEPMSPTSIAIHAFPSFLFHRGVQPERFVAELLERAADRGFDAGSEAALHEVVDMMACKAAIKAGDRLTEQEITDLMRHRDAVERASNCPHGRPTTLRLSLRDLEKQFGRR